MEIDVYQKWCAKIQVRGRSELPNAITKKYTQKYFSCIIGAL
jgi:hypothetical protein